MKANSTVRGLFWLSGLAVLLAGTALAPPSQAQTPVAPCPAGGFDVCFPNEQAGAPGACTATEPGAAVVSECLGRVCRSAATEPQAGFFSYCCAAGGALEYDNFCVFALQSACPAVAVHCEDRCPPLQLLLGTVTFAPPPDTCIATYPAFVARVCEQDAFCCSTSWDALCSEAALAAGGAAFLAPSISPGVSPSASSPVASPGAVLGAASAAGAGASASPSIAAAAVSAPPVITVSSPSIISLVPQASTGSSSGN